MTAAGQGRGLTILRQRLKADVGGLPVVWLMFILAVGAVVGLVAVFRSGGIEVSGWEQATQIARWYAGAIGVYLTAVYLPMYITHGYTRREFAAQIPAFITAFAVVYGLLMAAGYAVEALVYGLFSWPQVLSAPHLFDAPTQYLLIFVEYLLLGATWTVGGAVLGAAFYRNGLLGAVLIPVVLAMLGIVEAAAGPRFFGPISAIDQAGTWLLFGLLPDASSPGMTTLITAGVFMAGLGLVWAVVRDLPVRNKSA